MKTVLTLKKTLTLALLFGLGTQPGFADDSGEQDYDKHLVKDGLLGTVNVLRELDVKTWTNRVTVTSNAAGGDSKPEDTIDGSAKCFLQKAWDKDSNIRKDFVFARPGKFNQMLVVWDAFTTYENDRWNHLEVFGAEQTANGVGKSKP